MAPIRNASLPVGHAFSTPVHAIPFTPSTEGTVLRDALMAPQRRPLNRQQRIAESTGPATITTSLWSMATARVVACGRVGNGAASLAQC
jgi:hypothetical protein